MSANITDPLDLPALKPPPGVLPNYGNPLNKSEMGRAVMIAGLVISTTFLVLRLSTTWFVLRKAFLGDCMSPLHHPLCLSANHIVDSCANRWVCMLCLIYCKSTKAYQLLTGNLSRASSWLA